eukprot:FR735023.1.p1 GENE.FR735023.1~~FR735023.1.p1  ORF type:complete len:172 (+),score=15.37 FR735023.1:1-516(+)
MESVSEARAAAAAPADAVSGEEANPLAPFKIFYSSMQKQSGIKQALADALAGEMTGAEEEELLKQALDLASTAGCFMFTWEKSPACVNARRSLARIGAKYEEKDLDPTSEAGNKLRAVLGRHLGKSSVPMIFIGGTYVGGFSDGPSDDAPGLVPLAFDGTLRSRLAEAGAM